MADNMNPTLPSQSITSIREKANMDPSQMLPKQNETNGGANLDAVKSDAVKMGKI